MFHELSVIFSKDVRVLAKDHASHQNIIRFFFFFMSLYFLGLTPGHQSLFNCHLNSS